MKNDNKTSPFGTCIKDVRLSLKDMNTQKMIQWECQVYKKNQSYVKKGTPWIIDNEAYFLEIIGDGIRFPRVIATGTADTHHWVEITAMDGEEFLSERWGISIRKLRNYAFLSLTLLEYLYSKDIMHRDITTKNILVSKAGSISIIDFAWAINFRTDQRFLCPEELAFGAHPEYMYSDFYTLAALFQPRWNGIGCIAHYVYELKKIDWAHYLDKEYVAKQIALAKQALNEPITVRDYIMYLNAKYRIYKYLSNPRKLWKRITVKLK